MASILKVDTINPQTSGGSLALVSTNFSGSVTCASTLSVAGAATCGSTLNVTGLATLGSLTCNGALTSTTIQGKTVASAALAAITAALDKGIYFTGTSAASTYALTSTGRTLMACSNSSTMLSTLGAEAALGNPGTSGYVLASTTSGTRSWVANGGSVADGSITLAKLASEVGKCSAWVNFNGTGTVAINAALNVSSITDNGVGNYVVNLTNALSSVNFCPVPGACRYTTFNLDSNYTNPHAYPISSSACGVITGLADEYLGVLATDAAVVTLAIFQ